MVDLSGTVLHDTYQLDRLLGEGGMGEVYLASHLRLERKFAVKLLIPEAASDLGALHRFQREAQVTSRMGHPHIVEVIDTNVTPEGRPYLVMELLDGEDLATRIERSGALSVADAVSIVRQVTSALHAAHQQNVIHRDLKPENVFLCRRGSRDDYVKLLDFGISKVLGSGTVETRRRTLVGSPCYMAPEQADEQTTAVSVRTDVYAVGTMLFEMLTGSPPFSAASLPSLLYKIVHQSPPDVLEIRKDVSPDIGRVIAVAMEKDPDLRYQSMEDLWLDLADAVQVDGMVVEKTEISHTAWPEHPPTEVAGELSTSEQPVTPPVVQRRVEVSASLDRQVRSTTLSGSAGEIKVGRLRRGSLLALAVGGTLVAVSAVIFVVLVLTREQPRTGGGGPPDAAVQNGLVDGASAHAAAPDSAAPDSAPAPDSASAPDSAPAPDADRTPDIARTRPAVPARPPRAPRGVLHIAARHRGKIALATIYLDGRNVGQTPAVLRVRAGTHVLELRQDNLRAKHRVDVIGGGQQRIVLDLK